LKRRTLVSTLFCAPSKPQQNHNITKYQHYNFTYRKNAVKLMFYNLIIKGVKEVNTSFWNSPLNANDSNKNAGVHLFAANASA
jgi:hypothetical protein